MKIFAGKAAASYQQAKLIIKLANDVARIVNRDPAVRGLLKVVFLPNYNVSLAETIIPAADLSEQISTAGMEASGTGNMKFALNGALTIGTLDGANIEIRERVGAENIFIFGLTADEVAERRQAGIDATATIAASPVLGEVLDAIAAGVFSPDDRNRYRGLVDGAPASRLFHGRRATSTPTAPRSARSARSGTIAAHGGGRRSSTRRGWAGSPRTGRFASMRAKSGTPTPARTERPHARDARRHCPPSAIDGHRRGPPRRSVRGARAARDRRRARRPGVRPGRRDASTP